MASGSAAQFRTPGITASVASNTITLFRARAVDAAGNLSACSAARSYTEDSAAPAAPNISDTDPNSPANNNTPMVKGFSAAGSTVSLYTTAGCTGTPVASGSAAQFKTPGLAASVANNTTTLFRARATDVAGNASACSAARTYVEDSLAPAAPQITDTDPNSPANNNAPKVKGTAEAGSRVHLYKEFNCTGVRLAIGTAAQFASPGLTASVADNTTNLFRARAIDARRQHLGVLGQLQVRRELKPATDGGDRRRDERAQRAGVDLQLLHPRPLRGPEGPPASWPYVLPSITTP